jgi:hypothetical protein
MRAAIAAGLSVAGLGWHARAELARWAENVDSVRLEAVFFRTVTLGSGSVAIKRPPKETRPELTKLIAAAPGEAELYSLRALENEQQMDYAAAEADWLKYAEVAADKGAAQVSLADYYHRRLQPEKELQALSLAARSAAPAGDKFVPAQEQRSWKLFERLMALVDEQQLAAETALPQWRFWIERYPREFALYDRFFRFGVDRKRWDIAQEAIDAQQRAIGTNSSSVLALRAELERARGSMDRAVQLYEQAWSPEWDAATIGRYFALQPGVQRRFVERARAAIASDPVDLKGPVMLAQALQQQNNAGAALQALTEWEQRRDARKTAWKPEELRLLGLWYERLNHYTGAARAYHSLFAQGGATAEAGLASLIELLLRVPDQPIALRTGDLSLYQDIATADTKPGYLNGVLSLLFNSREPRSEYAGESAEARKYFARAKAEELLGVFEQRFPQSERRAALRSRMIDAYGIHGDFNAVIGNGTKYLTDFPKASERADVAMRVADAYARQKKTQQEFALYDQMLKELAAAAENVPLGSGVQAAQATAPPQPKGEGEEEQDAKPAQAPPPQGRAPRSPEYSLVLDRYLGRLVAMNRIRDGLALYRREIDRNPNDAGLYERLALFLEQNKLTADLEKTYRDAIAKFPDQGWHQKLARWYLRRKQTTQLDKLTQDVAKVFSGTDLEQYFREVVPQGAVSPQLSLQFNKYAAQRFPHNLTFVRNLMMLYSTKPTANAAEYEALLRKHWYHAEDLRVKFYELLSSTGRLDQELQAIRTANPQLNAGKWQEAADANPGAVRFVAEAEAWRGHFEPAAPALLAVANQYPADADLGRRAANVHRSLGAFTPAMQQTAIAVEERLAQATPRNTDQLIRAGELHADDEKFEPAAKWWNRVPAVAPGKPDGYLQAATVFWDYYRYDDALRLMEEGRAKTGNPAAFAYEAGAIQETKRNYDAALREYAKGAMAGAQNAEQRLLVLAKRPALRPVADQLTANLVSGRNPDRRAIRLRATLLKSQNRRGDLESGLLQVARGASSTEVLEEVENWGRIEGLDRVEQTAVEREIAAATDPVEKMRLRLKLARWFEAKGNNAAGAQVVDALEKENPLILGVVRGAADYHWRTKNEKRAVTVIEAAARRAEPNLRNSFLLEAAQKSTSIKDVVTARRLLDELMKADPWNARYTAAYADTYGVQSDDRGLREFYTKRLEAIRAANLPVAERNERIATLRRGLIPVLSRLNDHAGVIDQYVEILNRYPEDAGLAEEAAVYAAGHEQRPKLLAAYTKAMTDSPRDYRWPLLMARLQTQFENLPEAITSYVKASEIRPDRTDLLSSAAELEERLLRFGDAEKKYQRLYELSYRASQWMVKVAEMRARSGRGKEAEEALRKAMFEGVPERAPLTMSFATKLEEWGLLNSAVAAAEAAMAKTTPEDPPALGADYGRILTRARKHGQAVARLNKMESGEVGLRAVGAAVGQYFTPEEKTKFATSLATLNVNRRIAIAQAAGLADSEAKWRYELAIANAAKPEGRAQLNQLAQLQRKRGLYQELGNQIEAYWKAQPVDLEGRDEVLVEAAEAFRLAGSNAGELRVLSQLMRSRNTGPALERYVALTAKQSQRLLSDVARGDNASLEYALLNRVVQDGNVTLALQGIDAAAPKRNPAWSRAYTGLVGLYFTSNAPQVKRAFDDLLGSRVIGDRLGKQPDLAQQVMSADWFYYGSRYGEYLDVQKLGGADEFLPAAVEGRPASSQTYFELGEYYRERGARGSAREQYGNVLALAPSNIAVHDRLAMVAAVDGQRDAALAEWRIALQRLGDAQDSARVPASFWQDFKDVLSHAGAAGQCSAIKPEATKLLEIYARRNGAYNLQPIAEGMLACGGEAEGVRWLVELSSSAQDPVEFLNQIVTNQWVPDTQAGVVRERLVNAARAKAAQSFGQNAESARMDLARHQLDYAKFLLEQKNTAAAQGVLDAIPAESRKLLNGDFVAVEIRAAAQARRVDPLMKRYARETPGPEWDVLLRSATELRSAGDDAAARQILEFVYTSKLNAGDLSLANFLGSAEVKLANNDVSGAVALLRRMCLVAGQAYEGAPQASALLEKFGKRAEALEFTKAWAQAEPWNAAAQMKLAEAQNDGAAVAAIVSRTDAPYEIRAQAARAARALKTPVTADSAELTMLAADRNLTETEVNQPNYFSARVLAAEQATDRALRQRMLFGALAVRPQDRALRLRAFDVAAEGKQDLRTVSTFLPVLGPIWAQEDHAFDQYLVADFLASEGYMDADRARVAKRMADAQQRLGSPNSAEVLYRVAAALDATDAGKKAALQAADAIDKAKALRFRNESRRPVITAELQQDRVVRPREVAR